MILISGLPSKGYIITGEGDGFWVLAEFCPSGARCLGREQSGLILWVILLFMKHLLMSMFLGLRKVWKCLCFFLDTFPDFPPHFWIILAAGWGLLLIRLLSSDSLFPLDTFPGLSLSVSLGLSVFWFSSNSGFSFNGNSYFLFFIPFVSLIFFYIAIIFRLLMLWTFLYIISFFFYIVFIFGWLAG